MPAYILSVDLGTQGCKAALFDERLERKGDFFVPMRVISPAPGVAWQEPEEIYDGCIRAIRGLVKRADVSPKEIAAIGIDGQMAGIMGVDEQGDAVTVYDSWLDTRCADWVEKMKRRCGEFAAQITGGPVSFTHGPKILWLKQTHPEQYERVCKFVTIAAYVTGRIVGRKGREAYFDYTGLQYSGFGDNQNKKWSEELLEIFGVEKEKMARIVSPDEIVGETTLQFAEQTGLLPGIPVTAGCGDTAAAIYGTGVLEPGTLLDCAGSASVLCGLSDTYRPDLARQVITLMRSPEERIWYPMAYINGGGLCVRWAADILSGSYEMLEKEAEAVEAGSENLICIPHFGGRVLPYHPDLRGIFAGLNWNHTRGHLYRSVLEGIAYEYAFYLSILKKLYPQYPFTRLYSMGGGARSPLFGQIKADVLNVEVTAYEEVDTALLGTAGIAAKSLGLYAGFPRVWEVGRVIEPQPHNREKYEEMVCRYLELLDQAETFYGK